jgi:hypothetical protein
VSTSLPRVSPDRGVNPATTTLAAEHVVQPRELRGWSGNRIIAHSPGPRFEGIRTQPFPMETRNLRVVMCQLKVGGFRRLFATLGVLLFVPVMSIAQTAVSGSIAGTVRDTTGAVLPGVTIEASSPALIEKVRVAVTDDSGQFKLVDLRPGTYSVTFSLAGFNVIKVEGIQLTSGFTATVNGDMKVGAIEETVTVTGASPVVDVQNVMQQKQISRDTLDALPTGKTVQAFAALLPGAAMPATSQDVGGNRGEIPGSNFGIHGSRAADMKILQDGMRTSSMESTSSGRGIVYNTATVEEITLQTNGMSAESETGGVQLNYVPRTGSNQLKGYGVASYVNNAWQGNNVTDALRRRGLTKPTEIKRIYDYSGALGGPVKADQLWFFTAHRWWGSEQYFPNNYYNKTQSSWFYTPDLDRPAFSSDLNRDSSVRMTWAPTSKNKLNFSYSNQGGCGCFFGLTGDTAPESRSAHHYSPLYLAQVTWSYPRTSRLLFEAGGSAMIYNFKLERQPEVSATDIGVLELSNNFQYRSKFDISPAAAYGTKYSNNVNQRVAMSYVPGSHAFKVGLLMQEGWRGSEQFVIGDVNYIFRNGVPQSVQYFATPRVAKERLFPNLGLFAQDQWTIHNTTVNWGVRYDYFRAYVPAQSAPAGQFIPAREFSRIDNLPNWKDISPRLGLAYDLFGNGKTAIKGSLGRYLAGEGLTIANANNPMYAIVNQATRTWNDANRDFTPQPEELGPLSNSNFGKAIVNTRYADDVLQGIGARGFNWQGSASIQHELRSGVAVNVGYFRTWYGNFYATDNVLITPADFDPYCITAPVDARLPGGGGQQLCGLYDITPAKFGQVSNLVTQASTFGKQEEIFNGVDVTVNARFGQGGSLGGGLSTGRTVTDNCFAIDSPQQAREGYCHVSPPLSAATQVKLSAVYPLPWDLQVSATYQNLPGIPVLATFVASNAVVAPSLGRNFGACGAAATCTATAIVDLIPPGTLYEDRITQTDVRFTRIFKIRRARVEGNFDIYNLFNSSSILSTNTRFGSSWLQPTQVLGARLFKFVFQATF